MHSSHLTRNVRNPRRIPLRVESLESRITPYALTGNEWIKPERVTIGFVPDGTIVNTGVNGNQTSNLLGQFDQRFGSRDAWQREILRAAQVWAQQANINFSFVSDDGRQIGYGLYQQGDPTMADIRIGGYDFSSSSSLGYAYMPPPVNNYSVAGDVQFNTGLTWNIGSTYDLFSVAMHEIGHAIGMGHGASGSVMVDGYLGTRTGLATDDINGVQATYGTRPADRFEKGSGGNGSFSAATSVAIDSTTKTATVHTVDITTTSDSDFYKFVAPSGHNGTVELKIQSDNLSLLTPRATLFDYAQQELGAASASGQFDGTTLSITVSGASIVAGRTYFLKVESGVTTAFGTGRYGVTVDFGNNQPTPIPIPDTAVLRPTNYSGGGGGQARQPDSEYLRVIAHDHDHEDHDHSNLTSRKSKSTIGADTVKESRIGRLFEHVRNRSDQKQEATTSTKTFRNRAQRPTLSFEALRRLRSRPSLQEVNNMLTVA